MRYARHRLDPRRARPGAPRRHPRAYSQHQHHASTRATLDRMRRRHHQTETSLDAVKTELSTGRALFLFHIFYF